MHPFQKRIFLITSVFLVLFVIFVGTFSVRTFYKSQGISVGSKECIETTILGEIAAQIIEEETDIRVERKYHLEGFFCFNALLSGDVSFYSEYTGTALSSILFEQDEVPDIHAYLRKEMKDRYNLHWTEPIGVNNGYIVAQKTNQNETISELSTNNLKIAVDPEFYSRKEMKDLKRGYGWDDEDTFVILSHAIAYFSLESGDVDALIGYATDPGIARHGLHILKEDKNLLPSYEAAFLIRDDVYSRYPQLQGIFAKLEGRITTEKIRELNYLIEIDEENLYNHVRNFLIKEKLISKPPLGSSL